MCVTGNIFRSALFKHLNYFELEDINNPNRNL